MTALNTAFLTNVLAARLDPTRSVEQQTSDSTKFKAIKEEILSIEQLLLPIVLEKERESSKVRFSVDSALIDLFFKDST